jgi:hypothetical protein
MKDFQLYQQILGLVKPWTVKNVTLKPVERQLEFTTALTQALCC